jgi:hypothetical protein
MAQSRKYQHGVIWHCVANEDCTCTWNPGLVPERGEVLYCDKLTSVDLFSMKFVPCCPVVQCTVLNTVYILPVKLQVFHFPGSCFSDSEKNQHVRIETAVKIPMSFFGF